MATDQEIRDRGFKYIPKQEYLLNPFQLPEDQEPVVDQGIVATNAFTGGGDGFNPYNTNMSNVRQDYNAFPSRQAGEIYSKIFNPQPYGTGVESAQAAYNQANQALAQGMDPNSQGYGSFTGGTLTGLKDIANEIIMNNKEQYGAQGQYVDPYDPRYSSMTEANKFMDNYPDYYGVPSGVPEPGIPGAIKRYMENSLLGKGFGMAKDFLGRVMPINERAIMENEARGAGIFTDDIGRIVTDDYNTAGGIMAGYNLNKIDAGTFDKRRSTIEKTIADKKAKGLDTKTLEERLGLLDESEEDILGAKKKTTQIYKMRKDKKTKEAEAAAEAAAAEAAAAAAAAQAERDRVAQVQNRLDTGSYVDRDSGGYSASDRAVGGGREATNAQGQNAAQATAAGTGTSQGYSQHYMDGGRAGYFYGGRVNFKNGGLASIFIMAKIVQSLTRAEPEYNQTNLQSLVRDLDAVITKLNSSFQDEVKQEIEAKSFFFRIMAVVNQYLFVGIDNSTAGSALVPFGASNPIVNETYIIKSILVTSAGTPTVTVTNNSITAIKSTQLTANTTKELLTQPMIVVGGTSFTVQSSTTDSFDVAISYLNILKEKVD